MRVHERTPYPVRPKFRANTVQRTLIQSEAVSEIGRDGVGMSNDRLRLPPQNLDAERGVLGSVMLMNEAIDEVDLQAGEFYDVRHQEVYTAIRKLWRDGIRGIDAITLGSELLRTGRFEAAGGTSYLAELLDSVPHAAHVRYYAKIVRKKARSRAGIYLCTESLQQFYDSDDADEVFANLMTNVVRLEETSGSGDVSTMADALRELKEYENNPAAVGKTGLADLDEILKGGIREAQSVVIAGRPGQGKSVLACQIARVFSVRGEAALIVSLEMLKREIAERYLCMMKANDLTNIPLYFEDVAVSAQRIASRIRYTHRRYGIRIAVLDYLQLVESDDRNVQRERQVAGVSRTMKLLARELKIPIVIACQLNRTSVKENRKPRLSDLRESGAIEQDADIVLMLHEDESDDDRTKSSIIVARHRGGKCGSVDVVFDRPKFVFRNLVKASQYNEHDYTDMRGGR